MHIGLISFYTSSRKCGATHVSSFTILETLLASLCGTLYEGFVTVLETSCENTTINYLGTPHAAIPHAAISQLLVPGRLVDIN